MNYKHSIYFKVGTIILLVLVLLIPTSLVKTLVSEREAVQKEAIDEVSSNWSKGQTITGPYLCIPYDKYVKQYSAKDSSTKIIKVKEYIYLLPEELNINGNISPEKRHRGIYEVVVYDSDLQLNGKFKNLNYNELDIEKRNIHFSQASLNIGISDLKGIEKQVHINWNGKNFTFNSGTSTNGICNSGINTNIPLSDSTIGTFDLKLNLKGSQNMYFVPVGKTTDVQISSSWPSPKFTGNYLPDSRNVTDSGFTANWNVLHLNRNYPQNWVNSKYSLDTSTFGTDLLLPVDSYIKAHRVARYAILFIVLTFMVFFFVEVLNKKFIHPIQYMLVGIALVVFYTLLLSFSEHIIFNLAYAIASILTIALVTLYTLAITKSKEVCMLLFGILVLLYGFIFTIIQLEDFALLIGSIGVFTILAIVMYFSRKIDWYELKIEDKNSIKP